LRGIGLYLLIAILAVSVVSSLYPQGESAQDVAYTQFIHWVESGRIDSVRLIGEQRVEGKLTDGTRFRTYLPANTTNLGDRLHERGIEISAEPEPPPPWWISFLPNLLTLAIFVGIWLFILNQMQGGSNRAMSFGKSRAKLHTEERTKVRFSDVAGLDEAKLELQEIVEFLKHPKKFVELGAKIPKGVLLAGPPGTGKTLLARAVAGEAGVPFFSISGSDFVEMFVGVGAARVRDLFETAKKHSPCIVFIDELDAVGRQRGAGLGGGHDEREQTLNQLLVEMDGFEPNSGIIVMAATNRPDVLDPALLRPGRFDRKVIVDQPDVRGREEILKVHARNKPLADDVDLGVLARRTPGFSGADLENLLNEAAILAARAQKKVIEMADCEEAIDRVLLGPERKRRVLTEKDRQVLAYHEAGHAIVAHYLPDGDPVHKVTIVGRGMAGGYTMILPEEERILAGKSDLINHLSHLLGGRAAEEIRFKEVTTGAQNDLERATRLARRMVMEWGMSERLGPLTFGRPGAEPIFLGRDFGRDRDYSEEVASAIDEEVRAFIDGAYQQALNILQERWEELERVVAALLDKETLNREEFLAALQGEPLPEAPALEAAREAEEEQPAPAPVPEPAPSRGFAGAGGGMPGQRALDKGKSPKPAIGLE